MGPLLRLKIDWRPTRSRGMEVLPFAAVASAASTLPSQPSLPLDQEDATHAMLALKCSLRAEDAQREGRLDDCCEAHLCAAKHYMHAARSVGGAAAAALMLISNAHARKAQEAQFHERWLHPATGDFSGSGNDGSCRRARGSNRRSHSVSLGAGRGGSGCNSGAQVPLVSVKGGGGTGAGGGGAGSGECAAGMADSILFPAAAAAEAAAVAAVAPPPSARRSAEDEEAAALRQRVQDMLELEHLLGRLGLAAARGSAAAGTVAAGRGAALNSSIGGGGQSQLLLRGAGGGGG
ncbi:unnamed protein product, partial [Phaeothamnion confervicola]